MSIITFEDEVKFRLPSYYVYKRMYPVSKTETVIEVSEFGVSKSLIMKKVDIGNLFKSPVIITIDRHSTYNDVYALLSSMYSLGLVIGIDYYNNNIIELNQSESVLKPLEILSDSYGYYGTINVLIFDKNKSIPMELPLKDLRNMKLEYYLMDMKVKSLLTSHLFKESSNLLFTEDRLSYHFLDLINELLTSNVDLFTVMEWRSKLASSVVTNLLNDGLSDLVTLSSLDGDTILIRFSSKFGDLPILGEVPPIKDEDEIIIDIPDEEIIIEF